MRPEVLIRIANSLKAPLAPRLSCLRAGAGCRHSSCAYVTVTVVDLAGAARSKVLSCSEIGSHQASFSGLFRVLSNFYGFMRVLCPPFSWLEMGGGRFNFRVH